MSVLAIFTCLQKNRQSWAKTLLLNAHRVSDFQKDAQSPTTKTILYYNLGDGERGGTVELQLSHAMNTVATRLMEDETNRLIKMDVLAYKDGYSREKPTATSNRPWEICSDSIVYAYNISATQAYVFIDRGLNFVRLLVSHTVADISRAYSTSASLSKS